MKDLIRIVVDCRKFITNVNCFNLSGHTQFTLIGSQSLFSVTSPSQTLRLWFVDLTMKILATPTNAPKQLVFQGHIPIEGEGDGLAQWNSHLAFIL